MARLAEVCVSPAEPLCDTAAEFTLKLDEIYSVFWTLRIANAESVCRTFTTDKFFCFEFLSFLGCSQAIFHTTEVRVLTVVTEIVGALEDSPLL